MVFEEGDLSNRISDARWERPEQEVSCICRSWDRWECTYCTVGSFERVETILVTLPITLAFGFENKRPRSIDNGIPELLVRRPESDDNAGTLHVP